MSDESLNQHVFGGGRHVEDDEVEYEHGLVFVIMSFRDDMDETYAVIQEACKKLDLRAVRADDGVGSDFILREILSYIERAEFIICDLTHERPNCYYELGYAHGVGNQAKDILLIARVNTELHFDIAPFRVRYYDSTQTLRNILINGLSAMIAVRK